MHWCIHCGCQAAARRSLNMGFTRTFQWHMLRHARHYPPLLFIDGAPQQCGTNWELQHSKEVLLMICRRGSEQHQHQCCFQLCPVVPCCVESPCKTEATMIRRLAKHFGVPQRHPEGSEHADNSITSEDASSSDSEASTDSEAMNV